MQTNIGGLHHVTAMSGHPQTNVDFYHGVLGLRLVKVSVNQDDPETYHLFYGDGQGSPGSAITFFPWMNMRQGYIGARQVGVTAFSVPKDSLPYWRQRLAAAKVSALDEVRFGDPVLAFADPDGIHLELVGTTNDPRPAWEHGPVPSEVGIKGFHRVDLWLQDAGRSAEFLTEFFGYRELERTEDRIRMGIGDALPNQLVDLVILPGRPGGQMGRGTVHHVAFRTPDSASEMEVRRKVAEFGMNPTEQIDRFWFQSVYFREPGGVLYELATDGPGFSADELSEKLGEKLILPPWLEARRAQLETSLVQFQLPNGVSFPV